VLPEESSKDTTTFNIQKLIQDPLLNSAFSETLRIQMNGLIAREVCQDTTITVNDQPYSLKKGDIVFISMMGVHRNPEIYDSPDTFRLTRFLELHTKTEGDNYKAQKATMKNGVTLRNPFIWWGGGSHIVRESHRID
jgi:cytochrome P450